MTRGGTAVGLRFWSWLSSTVRNDSALPQERHLFPRLSQRPRVRLRSNVLRFVFHPNNNTTHNKHATLGCVAASGSRLHLRLGSRVEHARVRGEPCGIPELSAGAHPGQDKTY